MDTMWILAAALLLVIICTQTHHSHTYNQIYVCIFGRQN